MSYIINIGRQYGSGGLAVAKYLSKKLGIKAYDKDLLNIAAKDYGLDPSTFINADEKRSSSFFMGLIHSLLSSDGTSFSEGIITNESLFKMQSDTIERIANEESCIFVGRCADYVLRDKPNVYNVFLTADLPSRISRISERVGISPSDAEKLIKSTDLSRSKFYNYYTFKIWGAAESYDLCINTSRYGIEATGDFIIDYFKLK